MEGPATTCGLLPFQNNDATPAPERLQQALTIIILAFGLCSKLDAMHKIVRYVDGVLVGDVVEAGNEEPVSALRDLDPCHPRSVCKSPVGMQKDMGAADGGLLFAIECLHRHLIIGQVDHFYAERG